MHSTSVSFQVCALKVRNTVCKSWPLEVRVLAHCLSTHPTNHMQFPKRAQCCSRYSTSCTHTSKTKYVVSFKWTLSLSWFMFSTNISISTEYKKKIYVWYRINNILCMQWSMIDTMISIILSNQHILAASIWSESWCSTQTIQDNHRL